MNLNRAAGRCGPVAGGNATTGRDVAALSPVPSFWPGAPGRRTDTTIRINHLI